MNRDDLAKELEQRLRTAQGQGWHPFAIPAVKIAEEAIAALSASRPVGEVWRPIETAPRDGRLVILYSNGPGGIWLGYYGASRWYEHGMDGESYVEEDEVELWQPLPEPPRSHAEDEG